MSVGATATEPAAELTDPSGLVGRVLADRYRVTGLLGVGGIGRVYRAEHLVLKREVALKVLLEHYQCVPELQRRFEREAMALAALSHPNIVTITDFVSSRDATFLVMELIEGRDLDEILEEGGALPPASAFTVMEQLLSCLAYAHQRDVIHRDLKPQNVLVQTLPGGRLHAVVLDFGLAKFMDGSGPSANLTKTGLIVGTPAYMAPEQASGAHADKRADVYTAGIMLFEMLSGVHPFDGFEGQDLLRQHLLTPAPALASKCEDARVAPELEAFLARALAKSGADRFADGAAMLDAFVALPADVFVRGSETSSTPRVRTDAPTALALPAAPTSASAGPRRGKLALAAMATVALAAVGGALLYATSSDVTEPTANTNASSADRGVDGETLAVPGAAGTRDDETSPELADQADDEEAGRDDGAEASEDELAAAGDALDEPDELDELDELDEEDGVEATPLGQGDPSPPSANRPAARNPWRGSTPQVLSRLRRRIARGNPITRVHVRALRQYRRRNPRDVRATLLLGQAYVSRGGLTGALVHYRRAYQVDRSARGDPRMIRDIVQMAATESLHDDATAALIEIYGREALGPVRRAIGREGDAENRERLEDTLARLQAATGE